MQNFQAKPYKSLIPGVNAFGGANMSVVTGSGKTRRVTPLDHVTFRTEEQHRSVCDTVKYLARI